MTKQRRNLIGKEQSTTADPDFVVSCPFRFRTLSVIISLCAVAVWLSASIGGWAAPASPHFAVDAPWTTEKGLPENSVFSLFQTRDGYLWVGTGYGLARFDGIHFKTFDKIDAPGLNSGKIFGLFEDSRGNVWIGTETEGILVADRQGKLTRLKDAGTGLEGKLVTICEDSSGAIWLSTAIGRVSRYRDGRLDLKVENCNGLAADNSGFIWIGARGDTPEQTRLMGLGPIPPTSVPALPVAYEVPVGRLDFLIASRTGGYWRLANGQVSKCKLDREERNFGSYEWGNVAVTAACEDRAGNLIVGTYGAGVYWLNSEGKFVQLSVLPKSCSYVYSLCMDREGSLWVGTDGGGLNRVKQKSFDVVDRTISLPIRSICEDKQGGLWFGINNLGVDFWESGALKEYRSAQGITDPYVQSVLADRAGDVWVGTANAGLFQLKGTNFMNVQPWSAISVIYQDRKGLLWFGTGQGLECSDSRHFSMTNGLSADAIQSLADDATGNLWIGTPAGLNLLQGDRVTRFHKTNGLPSEDISYLYADGENVLWVATPNGLARFDGVKWANYSMEDGLISDHLSYLIEDAEHYLWIGSNAGLMRVNKRELTDFAHGTRKSVACRPYGVADGLPISQCSAGSQPAACIAKDGTMWFPTIKGLASVHLDQIHPNTNAPPVTIQSVRVQGRLRSTNSFSASPPVAVSISPNEEGLEIEYTSLNLAAPERARFRYRMPLVGHEKPWLEAGNVRLAQFPTLPPGEYKFEVTACNEDGVWNEKGASLAVTVLPPFWRKPWFITISALCFLGIIVGSVHYVSTQRLQRQVAVLRQQEALEQERGRIARDLHDQLGANLTQVALLSEMVEADKDVPEEVESHARQISSTALETTRALDEIVWTVNPSNDTLDGLINYVCKYAQEYLALAGLRYRLEVPSELPSTRISPELRHNMFLSAKEAVNNVVKHSHASSVWLRLHLESHRFILEIEDNGWGLAAGDEKKGRSGLRNMRTRMQDVGGEFEAGPGTEGGTKVKLIAPLGNSDSTDHGNAGIV
jgi:ligand-binding sensor domain-containing protein/signal transduction histidine kinase